MNSERHFFLPPSEKNVEFSAWSGDLVDTEDSLLGSSEYAVTVIGLVSFLLHCDASNLVIEILKYMTKYGG